MHRSLKFCPISGLYGQLVSLLFWLLCCFHAGRHSAAPATGRVASLKGKNTLIIQLSDPCEKNNNFSKNICYPGFKHYFVVKLVLTVHGSTLILRWNDVHCVSVQIDLCRWKYTLRSAVCFSPAMKICLFSWLSTCFSFYNLYFHFTSVGLTPPVLLPPLLLVVISASISGLKTCVGLRLHAANGTKRLCKIVEPIGLMHKSTWLLWKRSSILLQGHNLPPPSLSLSLDACVCFWGVK